MLPATASSSPLIVTVPIKTVSTLNRREHWATRARRTKQQRAAVSAYCSHIRPLRAGQTATVTLTRIAPRVLDGDNLQGALKGCRDAVAALLGRDDRDQAIRWYYAQERGRVREYAVRIAVEVAP